MVVLRSGRLCSHDGPGLEHQAPTLGFYLRCLLPNLRRCMLGAGR